MTSTLATTATSTTTSTTEAPDTTPPTTVMPGRSSTTTSTTAAPPGSPPFASNVLPVDANGLGASWRPGCPVPPEQLRLVQLSHWDFEGRVQQGALVVRAEMADLVVGLFRRIYGERFPIRRMRTIDAYGGDDDVSMADDNTSAFNCRPVAGTTRWSQHAYGTAIDINPVENPYVQSGRVDPPAGAAFADRRAARPGMAVAGGSLVRAFDAVGWGWGGRWAQPDYQHFSAAGR